MSTPEGGAPREVDWSAFTRAAHESAANYRLVMRLPVDAVVWLDPPPWVREAMPAEVTRILARGDIKITKGRVG